jgi:hypothetical protein
MNRACWLAAVSGLALAAGPACSASSHVAGGSDASVPDAGISLDAASLDDAGAAPQDGPTGTDGGSSTADGASPAGDAASSSCGANLAVDPDNCGACGHSCLGEGCTSGFCNAKEAFTCSDGVPPTIMGVDASNLWVACGYEVEQTSTSTLMPGLTYLPVTAPVNGDGANITLGTVVGSTMFWVEVHHVPEGGVDYQSTFVSMPTASTAGKELFTVAGEVAEAAFDGTYVFYANPSDSGNLWRANLDGSASAKIGPPPGALVEDSTSLFYTTVDSTSDYSAVRVGKVDGTVTTIATDPTVPGATWYFATDATNFYYSEFVQTCQVTTYPGVFFESSASGGTKQLYLAGAAVTELAADSGQIVWAQEQCAAQTQNRWWLMGYRRGASQVPLAQVDSLPKSLAFDANWLYYDDATAAVWRVGR